MKIRELDIATQVILKVVLAGLILAFLWVIRDILLLLLFSAILASAMDPMVDYFRERKIPRAVSVMAVYILVLGLAGLVIYMLIPPLLEQLKLLQDSWPQFVRAFEARVSGTPLGNVNLSDFFKNIVSGNGAESSVVSRTFGVFSGFFSFITVLVLSFYLVADEKGMKKSIAAIVPEGYRDMAVNMVEKIQRKMGLWILGQVILSVVIFIVTYVGLSVLGVKYALFLAMLAGLLEVVPFIGPIVSSIPAIFIAFIHNPPLAIAVALLYILIQKAENYILVPKVMEKTVGTSPLVVIIVLLVGFKLAGVVGLLVSVPLAGAVNVVINEMVGEKPAPKGAEPAKNETLAEVV